MAEVSVLKINGTSYNIKDANVRAKIPIYVQDYGAVGDGVTDDKTALQNAIDAAIAQHRPLEFESGKNYVTGSCLEIIYPNNQQHIIINGNDATIHVKNGNNGLSIHMSGTYGGTSGGNAYNWHTCVTIRDLTIKTTPPAQYIGNGISFGTLEKPCLDGRIFLENIRVIDFKYGLLYFNARNIYLNNCSCTAQYPFRFAFVKPLSEFTDSLFNGDSFFSFCTFHVKNSGTLVTRIVVDEITNVCNISGLHFSHCDFYGSPHGSSYIDLNSSSVATRSRCYDWYFDNCQWDQINTTLFGFVAGNDSRGLINDIVISNCYGYYVTRILRSAGATAISINNSYFRLGVSTDPSQIMTLQPISCDASTANNTTKASKNIVISNNIIEGQSQEPIYISNSSDISINGNIINNSSWTAFQLNNVERIGITANVVNHDGTTQTQRLYYLQGTNTGYNISGNTTNTTDIKQ